MKRYATSYFIAEGFRGVFLHGFMSFAAVGVIVACLIITGSFTLIAINIDDKIRELENKNEIVVFIDESLSDAEAKSVGSKINLLKNVAQSVFVSKEEALKEFAVAMGEFEGLFEGYAENSNLRHRYRVVLLDISELETSVETIKKINGVQSIRADLEIAKGLITWRKIAEAISVTLILVLLFVSLFIISNTIKLATFDRRDEIQIMRVVGATNAFIRWPFIIEGFLLGITASIVAFFLQWALYSWFTNGVIGNIVEMEFLPFSGMVLPILVTFVLTGFVVGVLGSVLTIRKFLRV